MGIVAFCDDLTPQNCTFLLNLETDDSDCEATIIVVLDSQGEDSSLALTAMVNLGKVLKRLEECQTKLMVQKQPLCLFRYNYLMMVIS